MKYSVGQCVRFNRILEECINAGYSFAVIHRGTVNYRADWRQSKGKPVHNIAFTIRQCFTDSTLNRVYGLTIDGVNLLDIESAEEVIAEFISMVCCNYDFRCANAMCWDLSEFCELLDEILEAARK